MTEKLKIWNMFCKKLKFLNDNNYIARKIYDDLLKTKK